MPPERSLTLYHQTSSRRFNTRNDRSTSPAELEAPRTASTPLSQQPPSFDLFSDLLFNREQVYQDSSASFGSGKMAPRKRAAVSVLRASKPKVPKTEANTKKKVDSPAGNASTRSRATEPIVIYDSDDEILPKSASTRSAKAEPERLQQQQQQQQRIDSLERELEAAREGHWVAIKEKDHLLINVDACRTQHEELSTRYADLQRRYEQAENDHTTMLGKEKARQCQIELVQNENTRLIGEISILKAAATAAAAPASPAPSSTFTDEEKKIDNIRRTYVKVKRRFDHLHKAASDLATCTRSWDLHSLGELGRYLRTLRTALEEESQERQCQDEG